jgi:4-amino-4-deoxy-L-arabinose transferase-like glycosyltransferase
MLEAGRFFVLLAITASLLLAFVEAVRLAGLLPALAGFLLVALDPFHVALSRMLHLDGLVSSLMLLAILAFLAYLYRGRRRVDLVLSGVAAGLGWLTKSPAFFLAPFIGLLALIELARVWYAQRRIGWGELRQIVWPLMVWSAVGWFVFVLLWPAMWVDPIGTLQRVFAEANTYAAEGHSTEVFFNGMAVTGDPGRRFYPVSYLWRSTPSVLAGLGLAGILFFLRRAYRLPRSSPASLSRAGTIETSEVSWSNGAAWTAAALILFAALFTIFMTFGSKKFDRYLLPVYAPLDLAAGIGWALAAGWLAGRLPAKVSALAIPALLVAVLAGQALAIVQTYPYYLSYYNPLLGGSQRAPQVMMIGWGEGIDQAARYLNTKPGAKRLKVMSWYPNGSFSYFFKGNTIHTMDEWEQTEPLMLGSDYVVTYVHQWQRHLPFPEMLAELARQTPERVFYLNGIEYVRIYKMDGAPRK